MWAARGTVVLPAGCDAEPLQGESIRQVLQDYRTMWKEGLIPMQAAANYAVPLLKEKGPDLDFGVAFRPGPSPGDVSSFAGGDVLTIPATAKHAAKALAIAQTPWTFHFNEMSNDNSSPWIEMVRTAIFEGDIDGAIARAKKRMKRIQCD